MPPSGINSVNFVAEAKYLKNKQTRFESQKPFFVSLQVFPESRLASQVVPDWGSQEALGNLKHKQKVNNFQNYYMV